MLLLMIISAFGGGAPVVFAPAPPARTYTPPAALRTYSVPAR